MCILAFVYLDDIETSLLYLPEYTMSLDLGPLNNYILLMENMYICYNFPCKKSNDWRISLNSPTWSLQAVGGIGNEWHNNGQVEERPTLGEAVGGYAVGLAVVVQ